MLPFPSWSLILVDPVQLCEEAEEQDEEEQESGSASLAMLARMGEESYPRPNQPIQSANRASFTCNGVGSVSAPSETMMRPYVE